MTLVPLVFRSKIARYYVLQFLMSMHLFGALLIPFFTDWASLSLFQIFVLQSWFAMWAFVLEVPTGVVADTLGRKYSLVFGSMAAIAGALLYGSVPQMWAFLVGEFFLALAMALQSGADQALLYDYIKQEGASSSERRFLVGPSRLPCLVGWWLPRWAAKSQLGGASICRCC